MIKLSETFGIIGDVHGCCTDLKRAVKFLQENKINQILCTGDIIDGVGDINCCFEIIESMNVFWVRGNHEKWILKKEMRDLPESTNWADLKFESQELIKSVPSTIEFETKLGPLLLCHGMAEDDMASLKPGDFGYGLECNEPLQKIIRQKRYKLIVSGHSHQTLVRSIDGLIFLNPGSLLPPNPEFFSVDLNEKQVIIYKIENEKVKEIEKKQI